MYWWAFLGIVVISTLTNGFIQESKCKTRKIDLVVVMDGTISLGYSHFDNEKAFVRSILSELTIGRSGAQVGIIQFSDQWRTTVELKLGEHGGNENVQSILKRIRYKQGDHTLAGLALEMVHNQFFGKESKARPGVDKVLLFISDGNPVDMKKAKYEAKVLKDRDVRIVTVAIGTRYHRLHRYKYPIRSMATGFRDSFKTLHRYLRRLVGRVAEAVCKKPRPLPSEPLKTLDQRCFQGRKDIVFAVDGSAQVNPDTFRKTVAFISQITGNLDITPSIIRVGFVQYSDLLNTRIEFGLTQYTKYYQVNDSLKSIVHSRGKEANLQNALRIINEEIFNGRNGDRISASDYLLLYVNGKVKNGNATLREVKKLKEKGVHVTVMGIGKSNEDISNYYEKLASHPNDVIYLDTVELKHFLGDLTATTCSKVDCKQKNKKDEEEESGCKQKMQDVLFLIDGSKAMDGYFKRALKFFTKLVKKLNIAATTTHVGLVQFTRYNVQIRFELGKYKFENSIKYHIEKTRQMKSYYWTSDIGKALQLVNKEIFNTSKGGHRLYAKDLIFMATRGNTVNRQEVQRQVKLLKEKGVYIAVLDVGYKNPVQKYRNTMQDIASGPREVFWLDFKRLSTTAQALFDVECTVEKKEVSTSCFERYRKVLFMLDSSAGLGFRQLHKIQAFMIDIVKRLYVVPSNIAVGLILYSDKSTMRYEFLPKKRPLEKTLNAIRNLKYRQGKWNYLGNALRYIDKRFPNSVQSGDTTVILLTHSEPADPEKAFMYAERLKLKQMEIITVVIHMKKKSTNMNQQYRALGSSTHNLDFNQMLDHTDDVVFNLCELNTCPKDSTKDCTPKKQDIFMIVDSSVSIGARIYPQLKRFVRRFVNKLDVSADRTNIGILQASDTRRTQYEMHLGEYTDPKVVQEVIHDMNYHAGRASYIGKGLEMAIREESLFNGSNKDRPDAENVLIIFTDGVFHDERLAKRLITNMKERGVRVVTIGLGKQSRRPKAKMLLESVASSRSDVYFVDLDRHTLLIESELNEVAHNVITLDCKNNYKPPVECSPEVLDVFVVIDGSRSVGWANFEKVQAFLKTLSDEFDIGHGKTHFGILQFGASTHSKIEFNLNSHANNKDVKKAIDNIRFLNSDKTDTGNALSIVNQKVFNGKGGDRRDVPNILILFTDGLAHDIKLAYKEANILKKDNTRVIGIGAGKKIRQFFYQLQRIATSKEDAHRSKFSELSGIVDDLLDVICR